MPNFIPSIHTLPGSDPTQNPRGVSVYTISELMGIGGKTKRGDYQVGSVQHPITYLTPRERMAIFQRSSPVQSVISRRAKAVGALDFNAVNVNENEDHNEWVEMKNRYDEWSEETGIRLRTARMQLGKKLRIRFPDLTESMSNFQAVITREKRNQKRYWTKRKKVIRRWLEKPNQDDTWQEFVEKWVLSLMLHGTAAIYKKWVDKTIEHMYVLPGGSVIPLRPIEVGAPMAWVQVVIGQENKYYQGDEIAFSVFTPSSSLSMGYGPLEAIIDKIATELLHWQFLAERADGTKPPEHLVVFGAQNNLSGDLTGEYEPPMDVEEQVRVEDKINIARKNAVATLSGMGTPTVHDISKGDDMAHIADLVKLTLNAVGQVYQATPIEMGLTGGDYTSGRSTSEAQAKISTETAIMPMLKKLQLVINEEIIPYVFGWDWKIDWPDGMSEKDKIELENARMQTGTYTADEVRVARGDEPKGGESDELRPYGGGEVKDNSQSAGAQL